MNSYAVAAAVATVLCLLLLIGPSFRRLSALQRGVLILLRLGVILLIVVAILRPTRISTTTKPQSAVLVMMVDQSRSMQLPHSSGQQSRWAAQREVLDRARPVLLELADKMEMTIHGYDMQLHPIELTTDGLMLPESANGEQTDIGSTLHEALQANWESVWRLWFFWAMARRRPSILLLRFKKRGVSWLDWGIRYTR